jgi:phage tail tape-measure protein
MSANERELVFRLRSDPAGVRAGNAEAERLMQQFAARDQTRWQQLGRAELRARQQTNREKVRSTEQAARDEARAVERHLGPSFFSGLASRASRAFKSAFSLSGLGGGGGAGGGSLLGSIVGGNLITSAITGIVGGVTDKIQGAIKTGFDFNRIKEQTLLGFEIKLKGRKEAEDFFNQITKWAQLSEQELPQVLDSVQRLMSAFNAPQALQSLKAITDRVAGTGKTGGEAKDAIDGIALALNQVIYKNRLAGQEVNQLAERQVTAYKYVADAIAQQDKAFAALTDEERIARVTDLAEKGMLDARASVAAIIRGMEKEFGGTSARIARETLSGIESNTSDRLSQLAGKSFEAQFEQYKKFRQEFLELINSPVGDAGAARINQGGAALAGAMDAALRVLKSGDFARLGFDAFSSLSAGVTEAGKGVYDAAAGAAGQAEQGIRDRLQMRSPSQVMLGLGRDAGASFVQGFVQGIRGARFDEEIERLIEENARRTGIDPNLIRTIIRQESGGKRNARSHAGAQGVMQLMPGTAARFGVSNPFDAAQNIRGGTDYLRQLLDMFGGRVDLALAGYNWGEHRRTLRAAHESGRPVTDFRIPAETRNYVNSILGALNQRQTLTGQSGGSRPQGLGPGDTWTTAQTEDWIRQNVRGVPNPKATRAGGSEEIAESLRHQRDARDRFVASEVEFIRYVIAQYGQAGAFNALNAQDVARLRAEFDELKRRREQAERAAARGEGPGLAGRDRSEHTGWLLQPEQKWPQFDKRGTLAGFSTFGEGELPTSENRFAALDRLVSLMPALDQLPERFSAVAHGATVAADAGRVAVDAFGDLPPIIKASEDEAKKAKKAFEEFADDIGDAFGSALEDILRLDFAGAGRTLATRLFGSFVEAAREQLSRSIFSAITGGGGGGTAGATAGGGGGGGGLLGSLFKGITGIFGGRTGPGGTPNFNPNAAGFPTSNLGGLDRLLGFGSLTSGGGTATAAAQSFSLGSIGAAVAPALPFLGLSLGSRLARGSRTSSTLGGAGGLLTGGSAAAFLAPKLFASLLGAKMGAATVALMTNPITIAAGVGLIVGGFLLGRRKRRKQSEQAHAKAFAEAKAALERILFEARTGGDAGSAAAAAEEVKRNYVEAMQQLPDGGARKKALRDVVELEKIIDQIYTAPDADVFQRGAAVGSPDRFIRRGGVVAGTSPVAAPRTAARPSAASPFAPSDFALPPIGAAVVSAARVPVAEPTAEAKAAQAGASWQSAAAGMLERATRALENNTRFMDETVRAVAPLAPALNRFSHAAEEFQAVSAEEFLTKASSNHPDTFTRATLSGLRADSGQARQLGELLQLQ